MDRAIAIAKLRKSLGKGFGYRENPKAPSKDQRDIAKLKLKDAMTEKKRLSEECEARRQEILAADQEYQKRLAAYQEARKREGELSGTSHSYRITVGNSTGCGFFFIKAEGDNWEEVVAKVMNGK